ncbi:MAG TPA: mannitol dehydrogenase family protein [Acidothermaceae bacterium]
MTEVPTGARLSTAQLSRIPAAARPLIDPRELTVGIVHLGLGAFHRAHQAVYTERAMSTSGTTQWGISAASLRSRSVIDELDPQDGLYTVVERGPSTAFRVLAPIRELLFAAQQQDLLISRLAAPSTRVVTLTVTEKGYRHDPVTRRLDFWDVEIQADAAGRPPHTVVGLLVRGLQARQRHDGSPLTVVCCDNLTSNGATLRGLVDDFCSILPPAEQSSVRPWMNDFVSFPSTVVDRITPATTAADRSDVTDYLGLDDEGAVVTEPFSQWVLEDNFATARPAWERAGAVFTSDVSPYESLKLRLLNGSHSALAYLGLLAGYEYIAEFVGVDGVAAFIRKLMGEAAATVSAPSSLNVDDYEQQLLQRFTNPGLRHRLAQIAIDGSQKLPPRLVATVRAARAASVEPTASVLGIAAWMRYVTAGHDDAGRPLVVDDPLASRIADVVGQAAEPGTIVERLLGIGEVFGDLADDVALRARLAVALADLTRAGALATLRSNVTET